MTPTLSPREQVVLGLIEQAATAGRPCPTNDDMAFAMNASAGSYAGEVMLALELQGVIRVTRYQQLREVEIVASGKRTAAIGTFRRVERGPRVTRGAVWNDEDLTQRFRGAPPADRFVLRDPCWRCGVRADKGCAHQPPSGTPAIELPAEHADGRKVDRGQGYAFMTRKRG